MPGIVGLITEMPRGWAELQLRQMVEGIRHEAFYEMGTWIDESLGVYVGWSVRRDCFSDGMPLRNERGDVVLIFSGEEFPEPGIARCLKEQGHGLEVEGPSYLVHLYEEDPTFPAGLNGRFHGLLADRTCGTAMLFNDRYGMHRLYYHESKQAVYFAAEAKAILKVRPELRSVDPRGLGEIVTCGCVLENRTVFEGIHVLPPASAWLLRDGAVARKSAYFQPQEWEDQEPLEPESYYRELRDVFARNLPRYFNGKEQIGMSLTGGLDTRTIMAWQKLPPGSLRCYTYGGTFRECRDVHVARQVASVCQQPFNVIPVGDEFLSHFPHYAERSLYLTDGCIDVYRSPDLYVSERAREIAPVRMTGLYGDEILRYSRAFKPVEPTPGLFRPELLSYVHKAKVTYSGLLLQHPLSFSAFRQAPWHHYPILALEQTQVTVRTPFLDNDFVRTVFRAPRSASANNDLRVRLIGDGNPALQRIRTDRGFGGRPGPILAAASRSFLEFTFKVEYAYDYGMPQWLARIDHVLSLLQLERLFLGRHKLFHFRVWYRDALSEYVRQILLDSRTLSRPYIERKGLEAIVCGHLKGNRNYTTEIHKLLTLELLHRLFLDPR
jgi:asparagine synthase (glutamine-hydrolysing)